MDEAVKESLLHFDPITLGVLLVGIAGGWYTLKNTTKWHTSWIKDHQKECDKREETYTRMFNEIQVSNATLTAIASSTTHRVDRIEQQMDNKK
jgi:hypothetical protein